ncbi:glutamate receptor ionotropic, kainate 2-like isoform X2 [Acanthaster planci]|uniref:Glutamate receptor ionotropic, kainate 2-like isoform X2 n=1 Tax=Acanthaster planci TaxID=133434 RepID=A0A8B7Y062_ACAPL|nr:glutamate receptor ionotropic, kainate 2-like isoform X2 [Acanthaster planci]
MEIPQWIALTCLLLMYILEGVVTSERRVFPSVIKVGVILEQPSSDEDEMIRLSFQHINQNGNILPSTRLDYTVARIASTDPFAAVKAACSMLNTTVAALVSSTSCETSLALQSLANSFDVPHIIVPGEECLSEKHNSFTVNVRPSQVYLSEAVLDLVWWLKWKSVSMFYDSESAYKNVQQFLHLAAQSEERKPLEVTLYRVDDRDPASGALGMINILHKAKDSDVQHMITFCDRAQSMRLIRQAARFGMAVGKYQWIITTQDWDMMGDGEPGSFTTAGGDISEEEGMRFLNGSEGIITLMKQQVKVQTHPLQFYSAWQMLYPDIDREEDANSTYLSPGYLNTIQFKAAYMYDAVRVLAVALNEQVERDKYIEPEIQHCYDNKPKSWKGGIRLRKMLHRTETTGLMGRMRFNHSSLNDEIAVDVITLESGRNQTKAWKIGGWDPENRLNLVKTPFSRGFAAFISNNTTFRIVTVVEAPFVNRDETVNGYKYSGFCIDMLELIAKELNLKYELYLVPDGNYGGKNDDGTWNGLIGEVYYGRADLAVAGMVINSDREEVVDFTKPFMNYGVGILMQKPKKKANIFAFLEPLHIKVWGCVLASLFVVGVLIYIVDRLSPYSSFRRENSPNPEAFDLKNSMWFAFASCMQQGGDTSPLSISGRVLSAFWWFFALIITATYTANLAAFLTVTRMENPINSLEDLATQKTVVYGTILNSSLHDFFEKRKNQGIYEKMWNFMSTSKIDPWVPNAEAGYKRVQTEDYAFFWDAPILDYIKQEECDVMTVGKPFNLKGYGIATPRGVPWRDEISMVILKMQERGELEELRKKWFDRESSCLDETDSMNTKHRAARADINLDQIAGAFYVLIIGAVLSFVVVIVEHVWHKPSFYKKREKETGRTTLDWSDKLPPRETRNNGLSNIENCSSNKHLVVQENDSFALTPLRPNPWSTTTTTENSC